MAGNGPAPADKDERRRSNEPARGEWVDLEPLAAPVIPELPDLPDGGDDDWRGATKMTWKAWREDPVTQMWSPSDLAYAMDTILLHNGMTAASANEVRLRMDGLGLTPKGKRDHRWRVKKPAETTSATSAPATKRRSRSASREARLSVVK